MPSFRDGKLLFRDGKLACGCCDGTEKPCGPECCCAVFDAGSCGYSTECGPIVITAHIDEAEIDWSGHSLNGPSHISITEPHLLYTHTWNERPCADPEVDCSVLGGSFPAQIWSETYGERTYVYYQSALVASYRGSVTGHQVDIGDVQNSNSYAGSVGTWPIWYYLGYWVQFGLTPTSGSSGGGGSHYFYCYLNKETGVWGAFFVGVGGAPDQNTFSASITDQTVHRAEGDCILEASCRLTYEWDQKVFNPVESTYGTVAGEVVVRLNQAAGVYACASSLDGGYSEDDGGEEVFPL